MLCNQLEKSFWMVKHVILNSMIPKKGLLKSKMLVIITTFLMFNFLFLNELNAATKTWTGMTSTDWTVGSNWGGAVPAIGDDAYIPGALLNYPVITSAITIRTLHINNLSIGANVTVSGGTLTVTSLLTVSATGTFFLLSGTAVCTGGITCNGSVDVQGGTLTSQTNITISGTLNQSNGLIWMAANTSTNPTDNFVISSGTVNQSGGTIYMKDYNSTSGTYNQTGLGAVLKIFHDWKPGISHTFNSTSGNVQFCGAPGGGPDFSATNIQFNNIIVDVDPKFGNQINAAIKISGDITNNVVSGITVSNSANFTLNGTSTQDIIGYPLTFYNFTLNSSAATIPQIRINANVTSSNSLNMISGIVDLNGYTFTLGSSGSSSSLSRTSSSSTNWFYGGTFKRFWLNSTTITSTSGNYYGLFPMGTSSANSYRPVELNSTGNITTSGFFTVSHGSTLGTTDLNPIISDGGFNITRMLNASFTTSISGVTAGTFKIAATMTNLSSGNINDIRLAVFTGGTTAALVGNYLAATGTAQNPTASRTGITTIANLNNTFVLASTNASATPLPIKLVSFTGKCAENEIQLNWRTESEINNDYFTIEKSSNSTDWKIVGIISGAGNSTIYHEYSYTDEGSSKRMYYRLKQTDFDGSFEYSSVITVNSCKKDIQEISVFPNPSTGNLFFSFEGEIPNLHSLEIYNLAGKRVYYIEYPESSISLPDIANGIYYIHFYIDSDVIIKKFIMNR